ncbi:EcsC family protein [Tessaracoccus sp. OH4464_COT-324]|uniref:EcsC family protein n=1 Tax=Tessaracoccus sp. OH4464_COT-324 TaxID=2491059 RepID=UPI000F6347DD|nr:EcsC family protein [Tessaracoccus sp. OH4464_COT-324]RRD47862.1 hypothetical protein EII42_01035 [Tessaracoccus sp. OH4464_COT-324]
MSDNPENGSEQQDETPPGQSVFESDRPSGGSCPADGQPRTDTESDAAGETASDEEDEVQPEPEHSAEFKASRWLNWLLDSAISGFGPLEDAAHVVDELRARNNGDAEAAIAQLRNSESGLLGLAGFVSGFGGFATMPVALPADLAFLQVRAARLAACIALLRGYDLSSPVVRSLVALSLAGGESEKIARRHAIDLESSDAVRRLHELPTSALKEMEQAVALRLATGAGLKMMINAVRLIPLFGGLGSGIVNMLAIQDVHSCATRCFPRADS